VQIIDKYFGNLGMLFSFKKDGTCNVQLAKRAEDFLREYDGLINAKLKD
jgi:hypothetical protein